MTAMEKRSGAHPSCLRGSDLVGSGEGNLFQRMEAFLFPRCPSVPLCTLCLNPETAGCWQTFVEWLGQGRPGGPQVKHWWLLEGSQVGRLVLEVQRNQPVSGWAPLLQVQWAQMGTCFGGWSEPADPALWWGSDQQPAPGARNAFAPAAWAPWAAPAHSPEDATQDKFMRKNVDIPWD